MLEEESVISFKAGEFVAADLQCKSFRVKGRSPVQYHGFFVQECFETMRIRQT